MKNRVLGEDPFEQINKGKTKAEKKKVAPPKKTAAPKSKETKKVEGKKPLAKKGVKTQPSPKPAASPKPKAKAESKPPAKATDKKADKPKKSEDKPLPAKNEPTSVAKTLTGAAPPKTAEKKPPTVEELRADTEREILSGWSEVSENSKENWGTDIRDIDDFGYDAELENSLKPLLDLFRNYYFRIAVKGLTNIPEKGKALLVANHAGTIPFDGLMLRSVIASEHPARRKARFLLDDYIYYLPFAGKLLNRLGAVRACQENGEKLLDRGELVAVFPEGVQGSGKLYKDRYRLKRFGRGGFIKLALRTGSPILPVAVVGSEEIYPMFGKLHAAAKPLGFLYIPITPLFPLLGPLGLLPLPSKWLIKIGEPIDLSSYGPEAEHNPLIVNTIAEGVRDNIQQMVEELLAERESVFF